jgi:hypothetical protein
VAAVQEEETFFADAAAAREAMAKGLEEGRAARKSELLARMEMEQCLPTWGRR